MKIAVSATGPSLDAQVEPRFGRCPWFLVGDTDTMHFEAMENPHAALGGGVGIQVGQTMAKLDITHVLTGNCGPNAFQTLSAAGITIVTGCSGMVQDAIEHFRSGSMPASAGANVTDHFGMGGTGGNDMGRGGGMGGGQGMGRGSGRGMGMGGGRGMGRGSGRGMGMGGGQGMGGGRGMGMNVTGNAISPTTEPAARKNPIATVDRDLCTGCGVCVDMCPMGAISLRNDIAFIDSQTCTGCGICEDECPLGAIRIE